MCEAFNKAILECRDKPIITLLEGIKHYLTKRITSQKELMNTYTGDICPRIQLLLEKNRKHAEGWTPTWHGDDDLSIFCVTNGIETYSVDLKKQTCACRKWDLTGIPCSHAISCIWKNEKKLEDYVSEYYSYSHIIYPTNGPQLWPLLEGQVPIKPPVLRRAIGRPKKLRNKVNDEPINPHVLPKKLTTASCHKCGAMGHNKRSCKGKRVVERVIPKGGNKKKGHTSKDGKRQKLETKGGKKTKAVVTEIRNSSQAP
ncbi:unnamed protein product [Lathyrus sativus]|nr:unnamed protein product [Lathyrus sativus]